MRKKQQLPSLAVICRRVQIISKKVQSREFTDRELCGAVEAFVDYVLHHGNRIGDYIERAKAIRDSGVYAHGYSSRWFDCLTTAYEIVYDGLCQRKTTPAEVTAFRHLFEEIPVPSIKEILKA